MIKVAIYGSSATGKTAISSEVMRLLSRHGFILRHCGEIVKDRVKSLGLNSPSDLPMRVHNEIDDETKKVVLESPSNIIVEGRYLDYVLNGGEHILFFKLNCSYEERVSRIKKKLSLPQDQSEKLIMSSDEDDGQLIRILYASSEPVIIQLKILDTTNCSISEIANTIVEIINN